MTDDARLQLAYAAAAGGLQRQDDILGRMRDRCLAVLSAAGVVASVATAVGFLNTDPAKGAVVPGWALGVLAAVLVGIGVLTLLVLWPIEDWQFGPSARALTGYIEQGLDIDEVRREATHAMIDGQKINKAFIDIRARWYRGTVALLVLQLLIVVGASAVRG